MTSQTALNSTSYASDERPSWPMRVWLAVPDWVFRVLGFGFFSIFIGITAQKYWDGTFWNFVPWSELPSGRSIRMPWVPVLVDLTYLLIAISFLVRVNPRQRASNGWIIAFTLFAGFAPLIFALWLGPMLGWFDESWEIAYRQFLWRNPISWQAALAGGILITLGNIVDVWGYAVLFRSFSIVPEARELKTNGPYRFVRHPVYLGQFLAQAGVWLFFARIHIVWIAFYVIFVAMQLYRSKLEERNLSATFGVQYEDYRRRTFWFV